MTVTLQADFQIHTLPSGALVYYRDGDHSYWGEVTERKDGTLTGKKAAKYAGISTVAKTLDGGSGGLIYWAADEERKGVAALASDSFGLDSLRDMEESLRWLGTSDSIRERLNEFNLGHERKRDDAADRGTAVHTHALNALASGEAVPAFEQMTGEERGYAEGVTAFWLDHDPKVIAAEAVVACAQLRVAGRFDLLAEIDGRLVIVDAKTSNSVRGGMIAQVAGYALLLERSGYPRPEAGMILHLASDGSYSLVEFELDDEDFLVALDAYRRTSDLSSRMTAAKKAAKRPEPAITDELAAKRAEKLERQPVND